MARRFSPQTVAVLTALAADPAAWRYGYELGLQINLKAGSLYPILMRLNDTGLLESRWDTDGPAGRPPRHLYRLGAAGVRAAAGVPDLSSGRSSGLSTEPVRPRTPPAARRSSSRRSRTA